MSKTILRKGKEYMNLKRFAALLLAFCMLFSMVACKKEEEVPEE
jgi:hypothetical protein